jgi:hypothetical protein
MRKRMETDQIIVWRQTSMIPWLSVDKHWRPGNWLAADKKDCCFATLQTDFNLMLYRGHAPWDNRGALHEHRMLSSLAQRPRSMILILSSKTGRLEAWTTKRSRQEQLLSHSTEVCIGSQPLRLEVGKFMGSCHLFALCQDGNRTYLKPETWTQNSGGTMRGGLLRALGYTGVV